MAPSSGYSSVRRSHSRDGSQQHHHTRTRSNREPGAASSPKSKRSHHRNYRDLSSEQRYSEKYRHTSTRKEDYDQRRRSSRRDRSPNSLDSDRSRRRSLRNLSTPKHPEERQPSRERSASRRRNRKDKETRRNYDEERDYAGSRAQTFNRREVHERYSKDEKHTLRTDCSRKDTNHALEEVEPQRSPGRAKRYSNSERRRLSDPRTESESRTRSVSRHRELHGSPPRAVNEKRLEPSISSSSRKSSHSYSDDNQPANYSGENLSETTDVNQCDTNISRKIEASSICGGHSGSQKKRRTDSADLGHTSTSLKSKENTDDMKSQADLCSSPCNYTGEKSPELETKSIVASSSSAESIVATNAHTTHENVATNATTTDLDQKKVQRLERIKKLMEAKKRQGLIPSLSSTTTKEDSDNVSVKGCSPNEGISRVQGGDSGEFINVSMKDGGLLNDEGSTSVNVSGVMPVVVPPDVVLTTGSSAARFAAPVSPSVLSAISKEPQSASTQQATDEVVETSSVQEGSVDSLDIYMAAIATEMEELQHTASKKPPRRRRKKGPAVENMNGAGLAHSPSIRSESSKPLSITLEEILALQRRERSVEPSSHTNSVEKKTTGQSAKVDISGVEATRTSQVSMESVEDASGLDADTSTSDETPHSPELMSDTAGVPHHITTSSGAESAKTPSIGHVTATARDANADSVDMRRPEQEAMMEDDQLYSGNLSSMPASAETEEDDDDDDAYYADFIAAIRRQQTEQEPTRFTGADDAEKSSIAPNAEEPESLESRAQDTINVGEDAGPKHEALDNPDDEDYRYNVVEDDGSQFYFDLVQKVGNKKELPAVNHSAIDYLPFEKNLYVQVREITLMKDHEVDILRKLHGGIRVRGKHCPRPIRNFCQCGLPDAILRVIEKREYEEPFPVQMQALPALMAGRDVIGIAETGSGKTLAYLLPLIRHVLHQPPLRSGDGPIGLILVPTRELAVQIQREAHRYSKAVGLRSTAVYGGTGIGEQLSALKRGTEIVVATPGRFIDVLTINSGKVVNLRRVTFCILDEADRMFDMGFEPQITSILKNIRPDRQTALFSATFPPVIESLARRILRKPIEISVGDKGQTASRIEQYVEVWAGYREKFLRLLQLLGEWNEHGSIIIFVSRQNEADELFAELLKYGYPSFVLHGGQDQTDRDFTLQDFKEGAKSILVATSVAARGLDVKSVVLVINFVAPDHLEDYVHRIGRTGRAGNIGVAYTFLTPQDGDKAEDLIKALKQGGREVPEQVQELADEFRVKCNMGLARQQKKKGFGGKGFKFTAAEKSRQQQERQRVKKEMGMNESDNEEEMPLADAEDLENPMAPMPPPPATPTILTPGQGLPIVGGDDVEAASVRAKALAELIAKQGSAAPAAGTTPVAVAAAAAAAAAGAARLASPTILSIAGADEKARQVAALRSTIQQQLGVAAPSATGAAAAAAAAQRALAITNMSAAPSAAAAAAVAAATAAGLSLKAGAPVGYPGITGGVPGLSSLAYIDQATGNAVDEFDINDYPQYARFKITHKDVLHRISDQTGAVLQVKGRYVSPEEKDSTQLVGLKRLYIEIIGATPIIVQRAKHEIRTLLEAISLKQLNVAGTAARPPGRYSVI